MTGAMMTKPKGILKAVPTIIPVNDCEDGVRVVEGSGGSLEREKALLMLRGLHRDRARKTTRGLNYHFGGKSKSNLGEECADTAVTEAGSPCERGTSS